MKPGLDPRFERRGRSQRQHFALDFFVSLTTNGPGHALGAEIFFAIQLEGCVSIRKIAQPCGDRRTPSSLGPPIDR